MNKKETFFYHCPICGNILVNMENSGVVPHCCGREMEVLKANTSDGKVEYHVPVMEIVDDCYVCIKIGKEPHPMTKEHFIKWIYVDFKTQGSKHGGFFIHLHPGDRTEYKFCVCNIQVVGVYAYCNLHGLWKLEVDCDEKKDAETCGMYPAYCGKNPSGPQDAYYSCD
ncbi:MAG: hypothetical protein KBT06_03915 [Prevotellaceae bacterium]|nr:hypothetical protein [Candidatus Colivivens equi]MCQ2076433.1 hypothetical protein [Bacteroidaceae bacterium]